VAVAVALGSANASFALTSTRFILPTASRLEIRRESHVVRCACAMIGVHVHALERVRGSFMGAGRQTW